MFTCGYCKLNGQVEINFLVESFLSSLAAVVCGIIQNDVCFKSFGFRMRFNESVGRVFS